MGRRGLCNFRYALRPRDGRTNLERRLSVWCRRAFGRPLGVNNSDIVDFIANPNWRRNKTGTAFRTLNSTDINTDGTAPKISYITPEFYQTVVGLTYVPDIYSRAGLVSRYADYKNEDGYVAALYNHAEFGSLSLETSLGFAVFAR